jgi:hypothetical protein
LYVAIAAAALLNLLVVLRLVDDTGYSTALEKSQRDAQVMLSLDAYSYGFFLVLGDNALGRQEGAGLCPALTPSPQTGGPGSRPSVDSKRDGG